MQQISQLFPKIQKFAELFQAGPDVRWWQQGFRQGESDVEYWEQKRQLTMSDWVEHFQQKRISAGRHAYRAAISVLLQTASSDQVKLLCIDCDNADAVVAVFDIIMPELDRRGYEYVWETSGKEGERGHLILRTVGKATTQKAWIYAIFKACGLEPTDRKYKFEIFPALKPNIGIRVPAGFHMRWGRANECTYKDKTSADAEDVIDMFLACKEITEAQMLQDISRAIGTIDERAKLAPIRRALSNHGRTFFYTNRNLPLPVPNLPTVIREVSKNCQAINKILGMIVNEQFADERGGDVHFAGLWLWNLSLYNDLIRDGKYSPEGMNWVKDFFWEHRNRPWQSHKWEGDLSKFDGQSKDILTTSCQKWHETFNLCDGCPHKNRAGFKNPRALFWGKAIKREAIREFRLVTHDWVRKNTFVRVKQRIRHLVETNGKANIVICSPQGVGKSHLLDESAVEIAQIQEVVEAAVAVAQKGKRVLISCPTGDLAMEHWKRCNKAGRPLGVKAFAMLGHENVFEKFKPGFDCHFAAEIKKHRNLGIGSSVYKEKYCGNCPVEAECPFPRQYTQCQEDEYQIVIIQHAHFTSTEARESILKKHFDVMFIDEAIVDALLTNLKARPAEIEILDQFSDNYAWVPDLVRWMRDGGYPSGKRINLRVEQAEKIHAAFTQFGVEYRIPDFIRFYNLGNGMDKNIGMWIFTPLPTDRIPICVITDATPPLEVYKIMLDDEDLEVFGDGEILDYRKMNPDNRVIQVLDGSASKTSLRGPSNEDGEFEYVRFCEILDFIADKARGEFSQKKILITIYAGEFWDIAENYLSRNYPDIGLGERVILGKMAVGTNKFEDCDVQFMVAGVYLSARDFHMQAYKLRVMVNYWNRFKGRPLLPNYYQVVGDNASIERVEEPVYRIESINNHCYMFAYNDFKYLRPKEYYHWLAERFMIAKTQQALRLRYNDDRQRVTYIFGKFFCPSFLITESVLEEELLGYLRVYDEQ